MDQFISHQQLAFGSRLAQIDLLRMWRFPKADKRHGDRMRIWTPSFFRVVIAAIKSGRHEEAGVLLSSIIMRCHDLAIFLLLPPAPFQIPVYCGLLHDALNMLCPNMETRSLDFDQMVRWLSLDDGLASFFKTNLDIPSNILEGFMGPLHDIIREELTFAQFWKMSQGFQRSQRLGGHVVCPPWVMRQLQPPAMEQQREMEREFGMERHLELERRLRIQELLEREQLVEMRLLLGTNQSTVDTLCRALGGRVAVDVFCQPTLSVPDETECSICIGDMPTDTNEAGQRPVVTACEHYYHEKCLDSWVNESSMSASNTCPSCRAVMC